MAATNSNNPDSIVGNDSALNRLSAQLKLFGTFASIVAKRGGVVATRQAMPLLRGYIGCREVERLRKESGASDDATHGERLPNQLTTFERAVMNRAVHKATAETIQLASLAYPVEGIEPYQAVAGDDGCFPAPHLGHLMSVNKAVQTLLSDRKPTDQVPSEAELAQQQPVLLTSLSATEYGYLESPLDPKTIRRVALNERAMMFTNQG